MFSVRANIIEELPDDLVSGFAFGIGLERTDEAVAENQRSESRDVFASDIEAALASGAGTTSKD